MEWLNTILQGVLLGGLYAMFAAGLSLIFGVMRLVNIAHGDLIVLAAYLALVTPQTLGVDPARCRSLIVVPVMAAIGYALQRGAAQPHARRRSPAAAAGDVRPLGHHPERAAGAVHRRQRQAQRRRDRGREHRRRRRARRRRAAAHPVRARGRRHRRPAMAVLPHGARPRLPRHLGRPAGGAAHGPRTTATCSRWRWRCRSPSSRSPACCSPCAPTSIRRSARRG